MRFRLSVCAFAAVVMLAMPGLLTGTVPTGGNAQERSEPQAFSDPMDGPGPGLLTEDLSSPGQSRLAYDRGQFVIEAFQPEFSGDLTAFLKLGSLSSSRVAVDVIVGAPADGRVVFVGCRAGESGGGYRFEIHPDTGVYALSRLDAAIPVALVEPSSTSAIRPGSQMNRIEIDCWSSTIIGIVNGQPVVSASDDTYASGISFIGAGVSADFPGSIFAAFDNLELEDNGDVAPANSQISSSTSDPAVASVSSPAADVEAGTGQDPSVVDPSIGFPDTEGESGQTIASQSGVSLTSLRQEPMTDSLEGTLIQEPGFTVSAVAGVDAANFYASAIVANPEDTSRPWDFGFGFRQTGNGEELRLQIASTGTWFLIDGRSTVILSGMVLNINADAGRENALEMIADGNAVAFAVNGETVIAFEVSSATDPGDVWLGTGFFDAFVVRGRVIEYRDFRVYSIEVPTPTPTIAPTETPEPTPEPEATIPESEAEEDGNGVTDEAEELSEFEAAKSSAVEAAPLAGPLAGALQEGGGALNFSFAGVALADLYAAASFIVPDSSSSPWEITFGLRHLQGDQQVRLSVSSTGTWSARVGISTPYASGEVGNLNLAAGDENQIEIVAEGDSGILAVNGQEIGSFDLSGWTTAGDVWIATGVNNGNLVPGRTTSFQDFAVWTFTSSGES